MKTYKAYKISAATLLALSTSTLPAHAEVGSKSPNFNINNSVCTSSVPIYTREYRTNSREIHVGNPENRVYGDPGMTISIEVGESWTTSGSISTSVSADIDAIIASASAEVGVELGLSRTTSQSTSGSWTIPAESTERGWVEKGNNGVETTWSKGYYAPPCTWMEEEGGSAVLVTAVPSYAHSAGVIRH